MYYCRCTYVRISIIPFVYVSAGCGWKCVCVNGCVCGWTWLDVGGCVL